MGFLSRVSNSPVEANYGGQSRWLGTRFVATAGTETHHDFQIPVNARLFSGTYYVSTAAVIGDKVAFKIIADDVVLKQYVSDVYVVPGERRVLQSGQLSNLSSGMILRTSYTSIGDAAVDVLLDWQVFEL